MEGKKKKAAIIGVALACVAVIIAVVIIIILNKTPNYMNGYSWSMSLAKAEAKELPDDFMGVPYESIELDDYLDKYARDGYLHWIEYGFSSKNFQIIEEKLILTFGKAETTIAGKIWYVNDSKIMLSRGFKKVYVTNEKD